MNENPDHTTVEDVLQSSELTARLLRRLTLSPGVIDLQMLRQAPARLAGWIARQNPLLDDLLARYSIDDRQAAGNQPLVMEQPWMVNINNYLTNNNSFSSASFSSNVSQPPAAAAPTSIISSMNVPNTAAKTMMVDASASTPAGKFRVSRSPARRAWEAAPEDDQDGVRHPILKLTEAATSETSDATGAAHSEGVNISPAKAIASNETTPIKLPLARTQVAHTPIQRKLPDEGVNASPSTSKNYEAKEKRQPAGDEQPAMTAASAVAASRESGSSHPVSAQGGVPVSAQGDIPATSTTASATALPLVQQQTALSQFPRPPANFVWRKGAGSLTVQNLLSAISSSRPLQTARRSPEAQPTAQPPQSSQTITPETARRKDELRAGSGLTTERILRNISRHLLIERERRGY